MIVSNNQTYFREGTLDHWIYTKVFIENEYKLGDLTGKTILEIGGHAGYFALKAIQHKAKFVYLFEPDEENIRMCHLNLEPYKDRVNIKPIAVWGNTKNLPKYMPKEYPEWNGHLNTGGNSLVFGGTQRVDSVALDSIIKVFGPFDVMKIDCESAEWPIILTSNKIQEIPVIVGEYHEIGGEYDEHDPSILDIPGYDRYTVTELKDFLEFGGYEFSHFRYHNLNIGGFRAVK